MFLMKKFIFLATTIAFLSYRCTDSTQNEDNGKGGWLKGTTSEKFDVVAKQLRGFDMTMVETGYRYQELYWAGQDENWGYANYQLEKIQKTIENGLERRPKRGKSAEIFLNSSFPEMASAINKKDLKSFDTAFILFTNACNNCHVKEEVPFFSVEPPVNRLSPIRR